MLPLRITRLVYLGLEGRLHRLDLHHDFPLGVEELRYSLFSLRLHLLLALRLELGQ